MDLIRSDTLHFRFPNSLRHPLGEPAQIPAADAKAKNTLRAYRSDLEHFAAFCEAQNVPALPASPVTIAAYLVSLAEAGLKPATMSAT